MMTMMTTTTMRGLARRRRRDAVAALVEGQVCWGHQPKCGGGGGGGGTEEEEDIAKEAKRYSRKARFFQSSATTTTARRRGQQQQNDEGNTRERSNTRPAGEGVVVVLSRARTFTREDVRTFAELTGDANPIHFDSDGEVGNDDDDASKHHHQKAIVHGALLVSMFPALVGSAFPGSKYLSQTAKFRRECDVGATVKATVRKMRETRGGTIAEFETIVRCAEDEEKVYVDGVALAKIR